MCPGGPRGGGIEPGPRGPLGWKPAGGGPRSSRNMGPSRKPPGPSGPPGPNRPGGPSIPRGGIRPGPGPKPCGGPSGRLPGRSPWTRHMAHGHVREPATHEHKRTHTRASGVQLPAPRPTHMRRAHVRRHWPASHGRWHTARRDVRWHGPTWPLVHAGPGCVHTRVKPARGRLVAKHARTAHARPVASSIAPPPVVIHLLSSVAQARVAGQPNASVLCGTVRGANTHRNTAHFFPKLPLLRRVQLRTQRTSTSCGKS